MPLLRAHLVDIKYIQEESIVVELFCRDEAGSLVVVKDYYRPNFYALPKANSDMIQLRSRIGRLRLDDRRAVSATQEVKKRINGVEETFIKIFVTKPEAIPEIKKMVSQQPEVLNCFEHDISLTRKFMLENRLVPFSVFEAEVVEIPAKAYGLPCYKLVRFINRDINAERPVFMSLSVMFASEKEIDSQILAISMVGDNYETIITWKETNFISKDFMRVENEEALLIAVRNFMLEKKPDIILFDDKTFDIQSLKNRAEKYSIRFAVCFDNTEPYFSKIIRKTRTVGVNEVFMKRLIRNYVKFSATDKKMREMYRAVTEVIPVVALTTNSEDEQYFSVLLAKAKLNHSLFTDLYPGVIELFRLIPLRAADMLNFSIKTGIDWLFVKSSIENNNVVINKSSRVEDIGTGPVGSDRYRPVIDPVSGLYHNVIRVDLNSLYYRIIINHNLSNETISCSCCEGICQKHVGMIPSVLKDLIERVHRINQALSNSKNEVLERRKSILDRILSSFYEYLNNPTARWHSVELCSKLNSLARETIIGMIKEINKKSNVIFSDYNEIYVQLNESKEEMVGRINLVSSDLHNLAYSQPFPIAVFLPRSENFSKKRIILLDSENHIYTRNIVGKSHPKYIKDSIHDIIGLILDDVENIKIVSNIRKKLTMLVRRHVSIQNLTMKARFFKQRQDYHERTIFYTLLQELDSLGYQYDQGMIIEYFIALGKDFYYKRAKIFNPSVKQEYDAGYYINRQFLPTIKDLLLIKGITINEIRDPKKQASLQGFI